MAQMSVIIRLSLQICAVCSLARSVSVFFCCRLLSQSARSAAAAQNRSVCLCRSHLGLWEGFSHSHRTSSSVSIFILFVEHTCTCGPLQFFQSRSDGSGRGAAQQLGAFRVGGLRLGCRRALRPCTWVAPRQLHRTVLV